MANIEGQSANLQAEMQVGNNGMMPIGSGGGSGTVVGSIEVADTIQVEATEPALVENIGDEKNIRLRFFIPKGDVREAVAKADDATAKALTATEAAKQATTETLEAKKQAQEATTQASNATRATELAIQKASEATATALDATDATRVATTNAISATDDARQTTTDTLDAKEKAERATADTITAKEQAELATQSAITAKQNAETATVNANNAKDAADEATASANRASAEADKARIAADAATVKANNAATEASEAKINADKATANANRSAGVADKAATDAINAKSSADESAKKANESATAAQNIADTLQGKLDRGEFKGEKGEQGIPGPAGTGTGDMLASVYDPNGKMLPLATENDVDAHTNNSVVHITSEERAKWNTKAEETTVLTGTLTAGATSLSLKSDKVTARSVIDIYASVYGIVPVTVSVLTGEIQLTFEQQSTDVDVRVEVR